MYKRIIKIVCGCGNTYCQRAVHLQGGPGRRRVTIAVTDGPGSVAGHVTLTKPDIRSLAAWLLEVPESELPGAPGPRRHKEVAPGELPWQC